MYQRLKDNLENYFGNDDERDKINTVLRVLELLKHGTYKEQKIKKYVNKLKKHIKINFINNINDVSLCINSKFITNEKKKKTIIKKFEFKKMEKKPVIIYFEKNKKKSGFNFFFSDTLQTINCSYNNLKIYISKMYPEDIKFSFISTDDYDYDNIPNYKKINSIKKEYNFLTGTDIDNQDEYNIYYDSDDDNDFINKKIVKPKDINETYSLIFSKLKKNDLINLIYKLS
jgi:hypothetical protein